MNLFFVHYKDTFVMVLKDLQELPYEIPHARKFSILQSTQALCLDDAINLIRPFGGGPRALQIVFGGGPHNLQAVVRTICKFVWR